MWDLEQIYRDHFKDVELYILALCKDPHLAEELTADVFFRAMRALPKFRGECDIQTWLCALGRNAWLSHMRKAGKTVSMEDVAIPDPGEGIEDRIVDKHAALQVHKILHDLPEPYKEVFSLRVFGQLSFQNIGDLFGKTGNWACVTYHRARRKIQQELGVTE